jgi:protein ImuA
MNGSTSNVARPLIAALRERVRRIEQPTAIRHGVQPFGLDAIDRALPGGGLARGALHEIIGSGGDEEDGTLAAAFAAVILARLTVTAEGIVLWGLARPDLYGPGLVAHGLDPARLVLVRTSRDAEILWALEEGLRTTGVAAVVGEVGALPDVAGRRLQLAAERSGVTAFVLRRWRNAAAVVRERALPSAAVTRWRIAALPSRPVPMPSPASLLPLPLGGEGWGEGVTPLTRCGNAPLTLLSPPARGRGFFEEPGVGHPRWRVELLRCRGGEPACWEVELREGKFADATDPLSVAAALVDRPATLRGAAARSPKLRYTG